MCGLKTVGRLQFSICVQLMTSCIIIMILLLLLDVKDITNNSQRKKNKEQL